MYPDDTFDITLVTYASASMYELAPKYCQHWAGLLPSPYLMPQPDSDRRFVHFERGITALPVPRQHRLLPRGHRRSLPHNLRFPGELNEKRGDRSGAHDALRLRGVRLGPLPCDSRNRRYFLENLYAVLKLTPGYLWRDPYFVGVIPAYEWAHPLYDEAVANWRYPSEHCST